jgi:hypothetical protein
MRCCTAAIWLVLGATPLAHASEVTTYGAGLKLCSEFVETGDQASPDLVAYTGWLSGYLSGINTTSNHRNNFLSHEDLEFAMSWLSEFCRHHPKQRLAEATWILVLSAKTGPAAHAVEVATYGSGYKSCELYVQARGEQSIELNVDRTEFIAWLGGYLSGVNAISFATTNAMGKSDLDDAVRWLDVYCGAHEQTAFSAAVSALIASIGAALPEAPLADSRRPLTVATGDPSAPQPPVRTQ